MSHKYVIRKTVGSFLSKDGRTCHTLERAKTFSTENDALNALVVWEGKDRPENMYLSPADLEARVWENWDVIKVGLMFVME